MKEIVDKITSYNVFNYLVPGAVFVALADYFTSVKVIQKDVILGLFVYYFCGLVISRVGSVMIDPALKRIGFVTFSPYADFVSACKSDPKIDVLSESNNMYRTFIAVFTVLIALLLFDRAATTYLFASDLRDCLLVVFLLVLFCCSYRKQSGYITQRIALTKKPIENG